MITSERVKKRTFWSQWAAWTCPRLTACCCPACKEPRSERLCPEFLMHLWTQACRDKERNLLEKGRISVPHWWFKDLSIPTGWFSFDSSHPVYTRYPKSESVCGIMAQENTSPWTFSSFNFPFKWEKSSDIVHDSIRVQHQPTLTKDLPIMTI